ncbi:hypothetical protein HDV00_009188 [Rhizophlyctis rosea]|nr:hypothetical protein HDV00_009188 [Rhizophlyctis rosea]
MSFTDEYLPLRPNKARPAGGSQTRKFLWIALSLIALLSLYILFLNDTRVTWLPSPRIPQQPSHPPPSQYDSRLQQSDLNVVAGLGKSSSSPPPLTIPEKSRPLPMRKPSIPIPDSPTPSSPQLAPTPADVPPSPQSAPTPADVPPTLPEPAVDFDEKLLSENRRPPTRSGSHLRIALINSPLYHAEVVLPLLYAFGHQPNVSLELFEYQKAMNKFGLKPILLSQAPPNSNFKIRSPLELQHLEYVPDVAILTTCARDLEVLPWHFVNVSSPKAPREIICLVHGANEWSKQRSVWRKLADPWVRASRLNFLTLSDHVNDYVADHLPLWKMSPRPDSAYTPTYKNKVARLLPAFPPVFHTPTSNRTLPYIAIQGNFQSYRRNYTAVFQRMLSHLPTLKQYNASLHLLGSGRRRPRIPAKLKPYVRIHAELDFPPYWNLLAESIAIIPAFANDDYLINRASSTIATSMIAGAPIIAPMEVIDKYQYLTGGDHHAAPSWVQEEGEDEIDTFIRVLKLGEAEWVRMKREVRERRVELVEDNLRVVGEVLDVIGERIRWGVERGVFPKEEVKVVIKSSKGSVGKVVQAKGGSANGTQKSKGTIQKDVSVKGGSAKGVDVSPKRASVKGAERP